MRISGKDGNKKIGNRQKAIGNDYGVNSRGLYFSIYCLLHVRRSGAEKSILPIAYLSKGGRTLSQVPTNAKRPHQEAFCKYWWKAG
jgi:hypothetical protein